MPETVDTNYLTIKINQEKIDKLQLFCQSKNLSIEQIIHLFIDACLTDNLQLINDLFPSQNNFLTRSEVNLIIAQALQPLLDRLVILEEDNDNNNKKEKSPVISINSVENDQLKLENINTQSEIPEEERKYLPRHEIWQMLKQTDYVKTCGYDAFLSAAPDQFVDYGIYFDTEKKRYYVKNS